MNLQKNELYNPIFINGINRYALVSEIKTALSPACDNELSEYLNKICKTSLDEDLVKLAKLTAIVESSCAYYLLNIPYITKSTDVALIASIYDIKLSSTQISEILEILDPHV